MSNSSIRPFIAAFSSPLPPDSGRTFRYDATRQQSQVLVDGAWNDAAAVPGGIGPSTRMTKVAQETTDDE